MRGFLPLVALAGVLMTGVAASAEPTQRVELPIKRVQLPDHTIRFSIMITVGGAPVEAMLDTGSSGLRLLPAAAPAGTVALTGRHSADTYGSGVRLVGEQGRATLGFGAVSVAAPVELTQTVECVAQKPDCPAAKLPMADYRIGGDGLAGQGFLAILGVGLRPSDTPNPLGHIGAGRWIVELPETNGDAPGRLILNPTPEEMAGFAIYQLEPAARNDAMDGPAWRDNRLPTCLTDLDTKAKACAPTLLDSGAVGFRFTRREEPAAPWPQGDHAALAFQFNGGLEVQDSFVVRTAPGTAVRFARPTTDKFMEGLNAGFYPFMAYDVLYDAKAGHIGLKARR